MRMLLDVKIPHETFKPIGNINASSHHTAPCSGHPGDPP